MAERFDVLVIGSGPGGYVAAIRCAQLGMKVAIAERYATLGGTCLNVGCIPSKALLDVSEQYYRARTRFSLYGIEGGDGLQIHWNKSVEYKDKVVQRITSGVDFLMRKNKITVYHGHASFLSNEIVRIQSDDQSIDVQARHYIIATGSKPATLPNIPIDKKRIISSTEALSLTKIPSRIVVIGGGVIGVEMGSIFARLGTEVTIVEFQPRILPGMDDDISRELERQLKKLGITIHTRMGVQSAKVHARSVTIEAESLRGERQTFKAPLCLMAIGRRPYTDGLGLENTDVVLDPRKRIEVNEHLQTKVPHIFAIGDVIRGPMLAHKAEEEGIYVAEYIAGQKPHIHYHLIPTAVYTSPEVAAVGWTEKQLREKQIPFKAGTFNYRANGRAVASDHDHGFVKILADARTDEVLGVHIIGPKASELIHEAVVAMEFRASAEDIARICHAHPTYAEAVREASLDATDHRPIHM